MKPPPFEPAGDLALGDYVSVPKYPKGTVRGWVVVSERARVDSQAVPPEAHPGRVPVPNDSIAPPPRVADVA